MTAELVWQIVKVLLGAAVMWAVLMYDMKTGERDCGVVTLAGGLAAFLGGMAGVFAKPMEALWLGRAGFAILVIAIIQWLRLRHYSAQC